MSYKSRTQKIFANLHAQTNLGENNPNIHIMHESLASSKEQDGDVHQVQTNTDDIIMTGCVSETIETVDEYLQTIPNINIKCFKETPVISNEQSVLDSEKVPDARENTLIENNDEIKDLSPSQPNVNSPMPECIVEASITTVPRNFQKIDNIIPRNLNGDASSTEKKERDASHSDNLQVAEETKLIDNNIGKNVNDLKLSSRSRKRSTSSSSSDSSTSKRTCNRSSCSFSGTSSSSSSENEPFGSDDSVKDPSYQESSSDDEPPGEEKEKTQKRKVIDKSNTEKKGKKRSRNPQTWQKNLNKRLRNSGESYIGLSTGKNNNGNQKKVKKQRPQKALQPPCGQKCKLKCFEKVVDDKRLKIFNEYWDLKDIEKQRQYISSNMQTVNSRYKYSNVASPRKPNNAYYFIIDDKHVRVCKIFFMATLAVNNRVIQTVLKKQTFCESGKIVEVDKRGKHNNHYQVDEAIKNEVREHIKSIPRIDSHYCRASTSKQYIEGSKTLADLHRDYLKICEEKKSPTANYHMYRKIFEEEFNISFYVPKKDQCELCLQFKNCTEENNQSFIEKYERHITEKEKVLSRMEKEHDTKNSEAATKVIVFDLQAVLPCPVGDASSFFYVSKLNVLNFTLYDIKSHQGTCFLWHEGEAQRGANEIGTCIYKYLENIRDAHQEGELNIIFFSDNCAGQNKNKFLIALYLYAVFNLSITSITHKFFITGHSQNEGDSVHATIEKAVKKYKRSSPIYIPDHYASIIRSAKKTGSPYKVNEICFKDIFDLKKLTSDVFLNIPKNVKFSEIRVVKVEKDYPNTMFYKTSFEQPEFCQAEIISSRKNIEFHKIELKNAYVKKPGITEAKKKGLLSLVEKKKCVPMYYLDFYNNL